MLARKLSGAAAAARPQPTFVSSSVNTVSGVTVNTVTAPAGIQNGDLLVAIGFADTESITLSGVPSGFNVQYFTATSAGSVLFIAAKTASSESGNYSFTWSGTSKNNIAILVYRNATNINTIGTVQSVTAATGTAARIAPPYSGTLVCVFGAETSPTITTPPSGLVSRVSTFDGPSFAVYDLESQSASATSEYSIVWSLSRVLASIQFQITNEPDVAPVFVASATTNPTSPASTLTINKPTGTLEGDLMVAVMCADGNITWTGDTGWTEVSEQGGAPWLRIAYKVAGASEGASYTFTASSSGNTLSGGVVTYRYAAYDTIGSIVQGANPLVLASIPPSQSQSILLALGGRNEASVTMGTPTSMTARITDNNSRAPSYKLCSQTVAKGPTGTRSMSSGSSTAVAGIMLAIKPTRSLT